MALSTSHRPSSWFPKAISRSAASLGHTWQNRSATRRQVQCSSRRQVMITRAWSASISGLSGKPTLTSSLMVTIRDTIGHFGLYGYHIGHKNIGGIVSAHGNIRRVTVRTRCCQLWTSAITMLGFDGDYIHRVVGTGVPRIDPPRRDGDNLPGLIQPSCRVPLV